ncbi:hypothetical protein GFS24_12820 [Chitinophaga sp. SYP-B3965]|uniref:hypothetical protein n=1 Tax=Chitinophaga sp. SYP-B3965 TaxID=2663120 RepID=UPI0012998C42|nr:hypothetical protein [Chitinophaga sp. SYP-B3965]MRG46004.1 hypothetical protein [Chitinophaga sp. SYP-B3965]
MLRFFFVLVGSLPRSKGRFFIFFKGKVFFGELGACCSKGRFFIFFRGRYFLGNWELAAAKGGIFVFGDWFLKEEEERTSR